MKKLKSVKRERFAQELAKGKTLSEASEAAGYSGDRSNAHRVANLPELQERVQQITTKAAEKAELTVARMMEEAAGIATAHVEDIKASDKMNAIKFITERLAPIEQTNVTNNVLIISKDEIARRLIYLMQKPEEGND